MNAVVWYVITQSLRDKYFHTTSDQEKLFLARMMSSNLMKKYEVTRVCEQERQYKQKKNEQDCPGTKQEQKKVQYSYAMNKRAFRKY